MIENETQVIEHMQVCDLVPTVDALRIAGWRMVQILAISSADHTELNYSFGLGMQYKILRLQVAPGMKVPSITEVFAAAYLYENEIRDLFDVEIERISIDWLGKVFDTAKDHAFNKVTVAAPSSERGIR
jgi:ech hydrogenase subunit D